jgi:hypothetical protein
MEQAARALRRGAAEIAGQVEKYVHEIRVNLEGRRPAPPRAAARRRARPRKARARPK